MYLLRLSIGCRVLDETLKVIKRCSRAGFTINTFMRITGSHLVDSVDRMARINRGRAVFRVFPYC